MAGVAALVLLGAATWWVGVRPCRQIWRDYGTLVEARTDAEQNLDADSRELARFQRELGRLDEVVAAQAGRAPGVAAFSQLLETMTSLAAEEQLTLLNVAPQPVQSSGSYTIADVTVGARGSSRAFLRFMDRLAQENPYQSLHSFSVTRPSGGDPNQCELSWTVRFYLLSTPELARGGPP